MTENTVKNNISSSSDIMERIRTKIRESAGSLTDVLPSRKSGVLNSGENVKSGELKFSEDLHYLNTEYTFPTRSNPEERISSHRSGFIGRGIVSLKRKLLGIVWLPIRESVFIPLRDYLGHQVRYLNSVASYVDERDGAIFWELVKKIDVDSERMDLLMRECRATLHTFQEFQNKLALENQQRFQAQENKIQNLEAAIQTTEKVAKGVEATFHKLSRLPSPDKATEGLLDMPDPTYVIFENRFRGSEDEIRARLKIYVDTFRQSPKSVLDIGCGRGELLKLFSEAKIASYGVDLDAAMVRLAAEKGVTAQLGDGIKHLASLPDESLGGIVAIQVVEHLQLPILQSLLQQAYRTVAPGGTIALETINPRSISAMYSNYFRDPTHVFPVHPDTLQHLAVAAGFADVTIVELSPIPEGAKLITIDKQPFMSPQWQNTVEQLNHNIGLLNDSLYGAQDYCLIAKK